MAKWDEATDVNTCGDRATPTSSSQMSSSLCLRPLPPTPSQVCLRHGAILSIPWVCVCVCLCLCVCKPERMNDWSCISRSLLMNKYYQSAEYSGDQIRVSGKVCRGEDDDDDVDDDAGSVGLLVHILLCLICVWLIGSVLAGTSLPCLTFHPPAPPVCPEYSVDKYLFYRLLFVLCVWVYLNVINIYKLIL